MRPACLALAFAIGLAPAPVRAAGPTLVSINMCTDQLALALADDDQILALSPYAREPSMSWYAGRARAFPIVSGLAEDVLPLKPDLVLAATFMRPATRALLSRAGLHVAAFDNADSIEAVKEQIRQAGALFGHPDRATREIARIDSALASLRARAGSASLRILPLQRRGWVSGSKTLIGDLLGAAGLGHAGSKAGEFGARLPLEDIVRLRPDRLLLSADPHAEDQGAAMLAHPALAKLVGARHPFILPQAMTVCAGPMLADAIERLASFLSRPN